MSPPVTKIAFLSSKKTEQEKVRDVRLDILIQKNK